MLFVVDVGNTNITFGVYDKDELKTTFRMMSKAMHTSDEYGIQIIGLLGANGISVAASCERSAIVWAEAETS